MSYEPCQRRYVVFSLLVSIRGTGGHLSGGPSERNGRINMPCSTAGLVTPAASSPIRDRRGTLVQGLDMPLYPRSNRDGKGDGGSHGDIGGDTLRTASLRL